MKSLALLAALAVTLSACGKQTSWQGQPGKEHKPLAGKFMEGELAGEVGRQVDNIDPTVKKAEPLPEAKPAAPAPAVTETAAQPAAPVAAPVPAAATTATAPQTVTPAVMAQLAVVKWAALQGKNWVLVDLADETPSGPVKAAVQAVKGTSAQTLPFGTMTDELRTELEKQILRLKGKPELLTIRLLDEKGLPVGSFSGGGWKFGPAK